MLSGRTVADLERVAADLVNSALVAPADLSLPRAGTELAERVIATTDGVDVLVNDAISAVLHEADAGPVAQLEQSVALHLRFIMQGADGYFFESLAYWARNPEQRALRDDGYRWLHGAYADIVQRARPDCSFAACRSKACQVLPLTLGGWITLSASRPDLLGSQAARSRRALLEAVRTIVTEGEHPAS